MDNTNDKPFLTYEQQIQKLIDKGLTIHDRKAATALLKKHSYFALVSGYKKPFKAKNGLYKPHSSLDDIYSLYIFDDTLRTIIFRNILKVEKHIKSLISYSFCETYGDDQQLYLDATKYNYSRTNQADINDLIGRLSKIAVDPKEYFYIKHQQQKHGNIPLWVMMKALTLGTVSKFYSFLPQNIQSRVSIEFNYVMESELVRMLDLLARVRNVCAHNERLFNYRYNKGAINDTFIHQYLGISKTNGQFSKGKQDSNSCKDRKCSNTWDFRTIGQILRMHLWVVAQPYSLTTFPQNILSPETNPQTPPHLNSASRLSPA